MKEYQANYRVYIEDTDIMGVVYHSNFLKFFERARTDMLRDNGCSLMAMAADGYKFAIAEVTMRYCYPAKLDDILHIETRCTEAKACSLLFEQRMHNQEHTLLCEANIQVVCVDTNLKPKRMPKNLVNSLVDSPRK